MVLVLFACAQPVPDPVTEPNDTGEAVVPKTPAVVREPEVFTRIAHESAVWGDRGWLYYERVEAFSSDSGRVGVVRVPSDIHHDTGASLNTAFVISGDRAWMEMNGAALTQTQHADLARTHLAWEQLLYRAPVAVRSLANARPGVSHAVKWPGLAKTLGESAPRAVAVRSLVRIEVPVPESWRTITTGPIELFYEPGSDRVAVVDFPLRPGYTDPGFLGSMGPVDRVRVHYLEVASDLSPRLVLVDCSSKGEVVRHARRYDRSTRSAEVPKELARTALRPSVGSLEAAPGCSG